MEFQTLMNFCVIGINWCWSLPKKHFKGLVFRVCLQMQNGQSDHALLPLGIRTNIACKTCMSFFKCTFNSNNFAVQMYHARHACYYMLSFKRTFNSNNFAVQMHHARHACHPSNVLSNILSNLLSSALSNVL